MSKTSYNKEVSREIYIKLEDFLGPHVQHVQDPNNADYDAILVPRSSYLDFSAEHPEYKLSVPDIHPSMKVLVWCK